MNQVSLAVLAYAWPSVTQVVFAMTMMAAVVTMMAPVIFIVLVFGAGGRGRQAESRRTE